jgi:acetylornithine/N-succinyldiaminopimelate aminotransferase
MEYILNSTGHGIKYPDIIKAENCTLFDYEGNKYLDLESGVWCTSVGHSHPRITKTISEQSGKIIHSGYCYLNPVINSTAKKILDITGIESGKCVFLSSGSESVEYSVQLIKSFSEKPYFLTMSNCYLSAYGISGERSEDNWIDFDWMNKDDIDKIDFSNIAAFVFEPGSSSGLVHFPPEELVQKIVRRVRECGGYVITNEVTTGMGRTGRWFGFNHYDFIPDITAIGKGLGNGYPVSCAVISNSVIEKADFRKFHYAQSHQNDPLGAAVANEVIEIIESGGLLQQANETGDRIKSELNRIKNKYGIIKEVRGRGLMIAVEFEKNGKYSFAYAINEELLRKNIIPVKRPAHEVFRIDPALTIEDTHVDYFLKSIEEIISGLTK